VGRIGVMADIGDDVEDAGGHGFCLLEKGWPPAP